VGLAFMESLKGCRWLRPQKVLEGCVSSWYTVGILIERPDVEWLEFRRKFVDMGGDGFYAPPSPLHREPVFDELVRSVEADPGTQKTKRPLLFLSLCFPLWRI